MGKMLEGMQLCGVTEESNSPWESPVVLIWKKSGNLLSYIDYRKLNDDAKKDCVPLPRVDNTMDTLMKTKWFSTLAMKSCY